ncbi:DUF2510 domain-containing protein [Microbacterium sp. NPDC076768]|uniref:DUF2510 domain-containing protein n=1 Tax=Microbacterium sp. NPDC076768 TaxID=3154858 RepID=UPI00343706E3
MSNVPAGWYPSPEDSNQVRYWDGAQWTQSTAPAAAAQAAPAPEAAPASAFSTPPAPEAPSIPPPPAAPDAPVAESGSSGSKKKWLIGGAIAAGVIVVGSVGAAIGGGDRPEPVVEASVAPVVETTPPAPVVEETPTPTPTPVVEEVDAVAFRAQAGSHLDDMVKDIDDIVATVNEGGFWRLISNSGEIAFNQGQLEALDVPVNIATTWPASLVVLESTEDALTDAISTQDGPSILSAVDVMRAQVEATRSVANTAQ